MGGQRALVVVLLEQTPAREAFLRSALGGFCVVLGWFLWLFGCFLWFLNGFWELFSVLKAFPWRPLSPLTFRLFFVLFCPGGLPPPRPPRWGGCRPKTPCFIFGGLALQILQEGCGRPL